MIAYDKLNEMKNAVLPETPGNRIVYELLYLCEVSETRNGAWDADIADAIDALYARFTAEGAVTVSAMEETENRLRHLSPEVKKLRVIMAAHAHSDMNWMWGYNETVSIVLSTFRTMLQLLKEYPDFVFSQSMASTYRIVEKHCPEMLDEIRKYVKEGRWEITASEWVEGDKNMVDGESQMRHVLYTRKYLSRLFDLPESYFNIAFDPDTFGHNHNLPELLSHCGVKYYYFCRGIEAGTDIFRFTAPSGASILALREAHWYNSDVKERDILVMPKYAAKNKLDRVLKVYGVGDHGGGATRRDLEKIIDFNTWPLFPTFTFGTFGEFFHYIDAMTWPTIDAELNFLNNGCYTSQAKIKAQNKRVTRRLYAAEAMDVMADLAVGTASRADRLKGGWEHVLFNHFHDILPGSCTTESRERALGLYQESLAIADTVASSACNAIADAVDYSAYAERAAAEAKADTRSISEGAGGGFLSAEGLTINSNPARGSTRIFTVFNTAARAYDGLVTLELWDYTHDMRKIAVTDGDGNALDFQVLDYKDVGYWGHAYKRVLVKVHVPSFGYDTVVVAKAANVKDEPYTDDWERTDPPVHYVLENEYLRAELDPVSMAVIRLTDKTTGKETIGAGGARLRLIEEDTTRYMTSWIAGRTKRVHELTGVICRPENYKTGALRGFITYEAKFGKASEMKVTVTLDKGSRFLRFSVLADYREFGSHETCVPHLEFVLPQAVPATRYRYEIANAVQERDKCDMLMPAIHWAYPVADGALQLISEDRNGFRGDGETLCLSLIRSGFEPDPTPDTGWYEMKFALTPGGDDTVLYDNAIDALNHPLAVATRATAGTLPMRASLLSVQGGRVSGLKHAEDGDGIVLRLFEAEGKTGKATVEASAAQAELCTGTEERTGKKLGVKNGKTSVPLLPYATTTVRIQKK